MKSYYRSSSESKEKKYEEGNGEKAKGFTVKPKSSELLQVIKEIVSKDYNLAVEELGEEHVLEILKQMLSAKYLKKFAPQTHEVKAAVKKCVSALAIRMSVGRIGEIIKVDQVQQKSDDELQADLEKLGTIKKLIASKVKTGIDGLIETLSIEMEKREKEKSEAERIAKEKIEAESNALKKAREEEVIYYETVKKFTHNFNFLAEYDVLYYSKMGGINPVKFRDFEQYSRFQDLREKVTRRIKAMNLSEEQAISIVVDDPNELLGVADKKILLDRRSVIQKEKERER